MGPSLQDINFYTELVAPIDIVSPTRFGTFISATSSMQRRINAAREPAPLSLKPRCDRDFLRRQRAARD
jgi:hypothetical protein